MEYGGNPVFSLRKIVSISSTRSRYKKQQGGFYYMAKYKKVKEQKRKMRMRKAKAWVATDKGADIIRELM